LVRVGESASNLSIPCLRRLDTFLRPLVIEELLSCSAGHATTEGGAIRRGVVKLYASRLAAVKVKDALGLIRAKYARIPWNLELDLLDGELGEIPVWDLLRSDECVCRRTSPNGTRCNRLFSRRTWVLRPREANGVCTCGQTVEIEFNAEHRQRRPRPFVCRICGHTFRSGHVRNLHVVEAHLSNEPMGS